MPSQESRQPHYPTVELVLNAIADWVSAIAIRSATAPNSDNATRGKCR